MNVQFKKGVLELLVMAVVARRDCYGYELVEQISQSIDIAEGTIYPLLRRLHGEGYFETYLKESGEGPPRKYYRLTAHGRKAYAATRIEWEGFVAGVDEVLTDGEKSHERKLSARARAAVETAT